MKSRDKKSCLDYKTDYQIEEVLLVRGNYWKKFLLGVFPYSLLVVLSAFLLNAIGFGQVGGYLGLSIIVYLIIAFIWPIFLPRPKCSCCHKKMSKVVEEYHNGCRFPEFYVCHKCKRKAATGFSTGS